MKRRDFLRLSTGAAAVATLPESLRAEIPVTPIDTLHALAARDEFFSAHHQLPMDYQTIEFDLYVDGQKMDEHYQEIYAPAVGDGYVVYWEKDNISLGTHYIRGRVEVRNLKR